MKYFLDTEFIEGFHKPLFGKRRHFIDLISIGIVCEDGSSFYAISNEYNYNDADQWVKENVILPLYRETVHGGAKNQFDVHNFHKHYGRSNKEIMIDLLLYIWRDSYTDWLDDTGEFVGRGMKNGWLQSDGTLDVEFYAYYADYDWVLFCSLFGRMIDLPKGFPMYCRDLKQTFDEKQEYWVRIGEDNRTLTCYQNKEYSVEVDLKNLSSYPKQENEHNALDDAKWNKKLFKFLQTI